MHGDEINGLIGILTLIPLTAIWTTHKRKMLELQLRLRSGEGNEADEISAPRNEIKALRETTVQYDLSFDTALQRLEGRMQAVEHRVENQTLTTR